MINERVQERISQQLISKFQLAYICVDHAMVVQDVSSNIVDYGFDSIELGSDVTEIVDFMVGVDSHTPLDLPMVASPSGIPISVSFLPDEDQLTVLIANASTQAEQRRQLQQAANENELLVNTQRKLMRDLEAASGELERKNQQLEEASRLQTSFLSGVSHEFRTPLTSIIGYTSLVREDLQRMNDEMLPRVEKANDSGEYLRAVQRSSKHLLSLVENLLDHGKLDSDEIVVRPKATDLVEVFDDVNILMQPLSATKHIEFRVSTDLPNGLEVIMDDSRLRQCLINLVGNAIKFTDHGSVIVEAKWAANALSVKIDDTGPGISHSDLEKIRLPFWQGADTGKAGTGLGLTITEKIIELMGGHLKIESEQGEGTTVDFELPAPQTQKPAEEVAVDTAQSLTVLLAEDDSDIASLITMMLIDRGVEVTHVENGALAVEALNKGPVSGKRYDIVLMDIHMPIMTGYEAIEQIRASGNDIPVLVMSASAMDNDRERAEQLGCDGYLVKPVEVDDLLQLARTLVRA